MSAPLLDFPTVEKALEVMRRTLRAGRYLIKIAGVEREVDTKTGSVTAPAGSRATEGDTR